MKKTLLEKLKKHGLLVLLSGLILLLMIVLLVSKQFEGKRPVPIARIEPKDTLTLEQKLSRLETYEQKQKAAEHTRLVPSEPIALDLGRVLSGEPLESTSPVKQKAQPQASASTSPIADSLPGDRVKIGRSLPTPHSQNTRKPDAREAFKEGMVKKQPKPVAPFMGRDGFYTLKATPPSQALAHSPAGSAFYRAVVEGKQKIGSNATVRIRLLENIPLETKVIPKHSLLFGRVSRGSPGRLQIKVHSFQGEALSLSVYDQDYQEGIAYQWQEPVRDAPEEGKEEALQEVWNALPYGGIAGSAVDMGKNLSRRLIGKRSLVLADHYPLLLKWEPTKADKPTLKPSLQSLPQ